jgi:hypothetical protein
LATNVWTPVGASTDGSAAANWSLGVLANTDVLTLNATSANNCIFTAGCDCAGISATAAYTGTLNFSASSLTHAIGTSGLIADCTGLNWGTGNAISIAGTLDVQHVTTMTVGTSMITMTGTGNLIGRAGADLVARNLTIGADAVVTLITQDSWVQVNITISGTVIISSGIALGFYAYNGGHIDINAGSVSGSGTLSIYQPSSGAGLTTLTGTISVAVAFQGANTAAVLAPGTYTGRVTISNSGTTSCTFTPSAGTYTFAGGLTVLCNNATATTTVNFDTNDPTIILQGNLTTTVTAGTVTITKSASAPMQVTGTAALTLNLAGKDYGTWIFTKSAGAVTFTSGDSITLGGACTLPSLTIAAGVVLFDANGYAVTIAGAFVASCTTLDWGEGLWTFGGNVTYSDVTTNTPGTAAQTFNGSGTQTWTPKAGTTVGGTFTVNSTGTVALAAALTSAHLTLTAGTFNPATYAVNTGNFSKTAGPVLTPAGLVGATWTVTGTFTAIGDIGPASGAWTLNVTGASTARSGTVTRVNASGGALLDARGCVDGGNNVNVMFGRAAKVFRSSILSGAVLAA